MKPIGQITAAEASRIRFVLTDIDDTLTRDGRLQEESYAALWRLKLLGIKVIPVTGRPAGWCDCIIRQWPVEAVIGENGAFVLYLEKGRVKRIYHPAASSGEESRRKLGEIGTAVLEQVPGARIAGDQFCRIFDLAVDFREEEPALSLADAENIKILAESFGARAKISSIHVNIWFGDYDKLSMTKVFLEQKENMTEKTMKEEILFCGDSPNDEPMFAYFPMSCGVANLQNYADIIRFKPCFITGSPCGAGFAELVRQLESTRGFLP